MGRQRVGRAKGRVSVGSTRGILPPTKGKELGQGVGTRGRHWEPLWFRIECVWVGAWQASRKVAENNKGS